MPVWLAFSIATIPLWVFMPLIQSGRRMSGTFGAKPRWVYMASFYQNVLALTASGGIFLFIAILVLLTIYAIVRSEVGVRPKHMTTPRIPAYEVIAGLGYLAIPAVGVLLAKVATGVFTDRYAMPAIVGLAVIIPWGAYLILDGRATLGMALAATLLSWFVIKDGIEPALKTRGDLADLHHTVRFLSTAAPSDMAVVIASPHVFSQLTYDAPPEFASRFVYWSMRPPPCSI